MRVSVDKNDSGYRADAHRFTVTIDGVKLGGCVTADEELGFVVCHVYDRDTGFVMVNRRRPGQFVRDAIYGKVVITPPEGAANV